MATINLRDYLKGIEELIDSGQIDEALEHCRHVLQHFPKNIDTYRLMGKAYLESKRRSEAADLFQRVLSSIPDDFVSHIGLSIVNEDDDKLNEAIWHMERAFEAQPSNRAVQDELRRLYGKREGYEPPKVRLTRGALARMYSHGDLHNQAIGELRGALSEDPQRPDLQVLLAEMYFKTNQQAQAIEICSQIIQKLPYCLNANRIMVDILRSGQRDIEANPYWERVEELDPYAAQMAALRSADQAPAESVTIEQLVLDEPKSIAPPKAWTSSLQMPAEEDYKKEELPDWLSLDNLEAPAAAIEQTEAEDSDTLSSLQDLEPGPAAGIVEEPEGEAEAQEASSPFHSISKSAALQADQIPDWLRELRPMTGSLTPPPAAEPQAEAEPEDEQQQRWTDELKKAGFKPTGPLDLEDTNPQPATQEPQAVVGGLPTSELRWLDSDLDDEDATSQSIASAASAEPELPEWLQELNQQDKAKPTKPSSGAFATEPIASIPAAADPIWAAPPPDAFASEPVAESESPSWLDELKADSGMADSGTDELEETAAPDDQAASRLEGLGKWDTQPISAPDEPQLEAQPETGTSTEDEENLSWLEGLAAKQGAAEEELLTTPEERKLAKPEWLQASELKPEDEPAKSETLNWLDQLADNGQAAASGEQEAETLEDFDDLNEPALEGETPIETLSEPTTPAAAGETTPAWLRQLSAEMEGGAPPSAEPIAPRPLEEAPDWLKELSPDGEPEPIASEEEPATAETDAAEDLGSADWLESEASIEEASPSDEPTWMPADKLSEPPAEQATSDEPETVTDIEAEIETEMEPDSENAEPAIEPESGAAPEPVAEPMAAAPERGRQPGGLRRRTTLLDPEQVEDRLAQARQALSYGNINDAVEGYGYMLRRRIRLEEIIADLRAASRRFPRQVALWQTLGDAYMRNNQLKDALECYTRAETLL